MVVFRKGAKKKKKKKQDLLFFVFVFFIRITFFEGFVDEFDLKQFKNNNNN